MTTSKTNAPLAASRRIFETSTATKDGGIVWFHWTSIYYFGDKEVVFAIAKDVTERKLAEREIEENI